MNLFVVFVLEGNFINALNDVIHSLHVHASIHVINVHNFYAAVL